MPDSYIVVLHKDQHHKTDEHLSWLQSTHAADVTAQADHTSFAGLRHSYDVGALKGYSGHFSQDVLAQIRARPEVAYVERDSVVWASELEKGAPWGLARLSHRKSLGFGTFNKYEVRRLLLLSSLTHTVSVNGFADNSAQYDEEAGEGVTAYVIDTYVLSRHCSRSLAFRKPHKVFSPPNSGVNINHVEFEGRAKVRNQGSCPSARSY